MTNPGPAIGLSLLGLCLSLCVAAEGTPESREIEWLKQNAIPLKTAEPGKGFEDLGRLKALIGEARIVSLGECTHGTREVFQMKHRMLEYLSTECGFTIFAIEASMPEAYRLNDYVLHGKGDPAKLIAGMYFWTWNTEEVLAMVEWMRAYNQSGKGRLEFTGFDMQTPDVAMENVVRFLKTTAADRARAVDAQYQDILKARLLRGAGGGGAGFGVATGTFPIDIVKGKKIKYSGWIKTRGVTRGFAGLWWRADGQTGVLAFDNMESRGIKGDTDWKEYSVELDIPQTAINVNFGAILPGNGTAWFDDLKVEINGEPYETGNRFDFDFESGKIVGFFLGGAGYETRVDNEVARTGKRSLRMESREKSTGEASKYEPAAAAESCGKILAALEADRDGLAKASSARDTDWAIQNARVVHQCLQSEAQQAQRDACMAKNVKWILDQSPKDAKMVVWAHNGHVARIRSFIYMTMGACLDEVYGKQQVVIGFAAGQGTYTAIASGKGLRSDNRLQEPVDGSYESWFRAAEVPMFLLDLRKAKQQDSASDWLLRSRPFRSIGALAMDEQFGPAKLPDLFDAVIYLDRTTASRLLPGAGGVRAKQ